jgi:cytochrome c553
MIKRSAALFCIMFYVVMAGGTGYSEPRAKIDYLANCVRCHGVDGKGVFQR